MQPVYLICGVPGAGKTWVCEKLVDQYHYIPHDAYIEEGDYIHTLDVVRESMMSNRPIITECPSDESKKKEILVHTYGMKVIPIFVVNDPDIIEDQYIKREGKAFSKANRTRAVTIKERAHEWRAFAGTSDEVLNHLKSAI